VKTKIAVRLSILVEENKLGLFLADGVRLTNLEAGFSVKPDGTYVSQLGLETKQVHVVEGMQEGYLELDGSPDMVLELVCDSSVRKDKDFLRQRYWDAGIHEYWLVDARGEALKFDILRHGSSGYSPTRKQQGWVRSVVFGRSFHFSRQTTALGHPDFILEIK
jgi:Uma2 family endonuclease